MGDQNLLKHDDNSAEFQFKMQVIEQVKKMIDDKAVIIRNEIQMAIEARDSETKSTIGDEMETDRAMAQFQLEKAQAQLEKVNQLENELLKIDLTRNFKKAVLGSLLFTSVGNYFIFSALGKIEVGDKTVYCISLNSPIGMKLFNKKAGEKINFQNKDIQITEII